MKTLRHVTFYFILFSLLCAITTKSESAPGGTCQVGDIIQPGESCTYPGTDAEFSVDDAGRARFLFFTAGGNLIIRDANINGKSYTLVTEHSEGGGRRITELAGDTAPPVDDDTTIDEPGDDDTILIPDPNLAAAIREEIGNSITRQTLLNLTRLSATFSEITDLTGLEHARNLEWLDLRYNSISDISPLAELKKLTSLRLAGNSISDISPLAKLTQLTTLYLSLNSISDISPLAELKKLGWLEFSDNSVSDISALAECKQLTYLYIHNNSISDITPLAELKKLYGLQLDGNTISDISPLAELTKLGWLAIRRNNISDVSPLAKLTKLTSLDLINNNISDVSPLIKLNLPGTEWDSTGLDITGNPLSYASINTHIPAMQARGIGVEFDDRTPTTLVKILGIAQEVPVNTALPLPFVVEVQDEQNRPFAGVPVTFRITAGSGRLNAATTTDTTGRASARLTTGQTAGTTTVRVTATDVSQPVQFTATAIPRSAPVPIPDVNLREKIAETLRKPLGETPTAADMLTLTTLTANDANIYDLTGLQYASNLTTLSLNNNSISDVSPVAALPRLTRLDLRNNWISDVSPVAGLSNLQRLFLQGNALSDTSVQRHIPELQAAGVNVRFDSVSTPHEGPIVRLIYFRPRDRQPQPDINPQMDRLIKDVQQFYADQMENHGFGRKTFQFEIDAHGNAVVYHVVGRFEDTYYHNEAGVIWGEIHEQFDTSKYIYLTALDVSSELIGTGGGDTACGVASGGNYWGDALIPASGYCFIDSVAARELEHDTAAHELGHVFGLKHDFRSDTYIMSYGAVRDELAQCAVEWLDVHPAFNSNRAASTAKTAIEMLSSSLASAPNAIRLRFKVTDPDGVHQVQLLTETLSGAAAGQLELIACKHLNQTPSNTINFVTTSLIPANRTVSVQVIDVHGNLTRSEQFPIDIASLLPPARVVRIPDPNLAAALREEIGNSITTHTLLNLVRFEARNREITDLRGLEHARNLRELDLGTEWIGEGVVNSNAISDFSPIAGLPHLTQLDLTYFGLSDVSLLSGLRQLTDLDLRGNSISDIAPLAKLTQLTELQLWDNIISDISPLAKLTQLTYLDLGRNSISDISPLAKLTQLTTLYLEGNIISDVSPLAELKKLPSLNLGDNAISDISALAELTQLTGSDLGGNSISDVSPLAELTQLTYLNLYDNAISDISPLAELTQLTYLNLNDNAISDISPLAKLTQLIRLQLYDNSITDVSPIVGLNLTGAIHLTGMEWDRVGLDIRRNPLNAAAITTHIPAMRAKGIVVAFEGSTVLTQGAGEKIVGPWLWVIAPTGWSGSYAAVLQRDFLSEMSGGSVTELEIATNGATAGDPVGDSVWTLHTLSATGIDNINDMVNAAGLGTGNIDTHVAYGSIALEAPREQQTQMFAGSDDAIKVWLNGELVHNNPVNRGATDFQDQFPVTLKKGTNILLVAVYEGWGAWSGFFGFASDAEYTIPTQVALPAWDVNEDGIVNIQDIVLVASSFGQTGESRADVNGDGVVNIQDLVLVAGAFGEGASAAPTLHLSGLEGFTAAEVQDLLTQARQMAFTDPAYLRGIEVLEQLLALLLPKETALLANYPNPFNPETWIPYQLAEPGDVRLTIYDIQGCMVRALDLGHQRAGQYQSRSRAAYWDGRNAVGEPVASGLYFYTLTVGDFSATRKMLIRK